MVAACNHVTFFVRQITSCHRRSSQTKALDQKSGRLGIHFVNATYDNPAGLEREKRVPNTP